METAETTWRAWHGGLNGHPSTKMMGLTKLQEDVLGLLEEAGIPTAVNDKIMMLIAEAERQLDEQPLETE